MTHHDIPMVPATEYRRYHYGVLHTSAFVYRTTKSHSPTRIEVWDNMSRPNPFRGAKLGEVIRGQAITERFLSTGKTEPRWLDPYNEPTDAKISILLSTEASAMCSTPGMNTGQPGSGQVYAPDTRLAEGDTATLRFTDGHRQDVTLHFTNNGHGYAVLKFTPVEPRCNHPDCIDPADSHISHGDHDDQLKTALRTLTGTIPEELHSEETSKAAELLFDFINYRAQP